MSGGTRILCLAIAVSLTAATLLALPVQAGPSCPGVNRLDETFANGARWQLCWDVRSREGLVYRELYYTPPGGSERKLMEEMSLAQIHVPYDDNGARFHDITDYGAGGSNLNDLTNADCPDGSLLQDGSKNVVCKRVVRRGSAYDATTGQVQGGLLELFSVSHIGAYNYIPNFRFYDDGSLEVLMGATGQLQRFEYDNPSSTDIGWPLDAAADRIGISHIHNYYFRMDFDLGGTSNDDIVEQIDIATDPSGSTRTLSVTPFSSEAAADVAPTALRSWRIRDGAIANSNGHAISYELVPLESGHRDVGPSYEPFTHDDFYVTNYSACEQYASHNNQLLGCGDNLQDFVSGESLVGADPVLWYGLTFHHTPRDEDEARMHAHWNGFRLEARDWSAATPLSVDAQECAPGALDFDTLALESYANQDGVGTAVSSHEGTTLSMTGDTWKRTMGTYTIDPGSLLEFDFASSSEGEIHSIGFDEDGASSTMLNDGPRHFDLWGTQDWGGGGRIAYSPQYTGGGDFQSYSIPVGQSYTGNGLHLVFGNDMDSGTQNNDGRFRCVRIVKPPSPPVWTNPGAQSSSEGEAISLFLSAIDPESQPVTYSAIGLPPGLSIVESTGEVSGVLDYAGAGSYSVLATASDSVDSADQAFTWNVANVNRAPVWNDPGSLTSSEAEVVSIFLTALDPDGQSVTYAATGLPPGLSVTPETGEVAGSLDYASAGVYSVVATATDGSAPADQPLSWTVVNVNRAPVWNDPGAQSHVEGDTVSMFLLALDPDAESVSYSAVNLPSGLGVNIATGEVSGTLGYESSGSFAVVATASDGLATSDQPISWTVGNTNRAPVWTPPGDPSYQEGEAVSLALSAPDPDGDAVAIVVTGLPPGLSFDDVSDAIVGSPSYGAASGSPYSVLLEASDGFLDDTLVIQIAVSEGVPAVPLGSWIVRALIVGLLALLAERRLRKPSLSAVGRKPSPIL